MYINIGVDIDGVIANFHASFTTMANKKYGDRCPIIKDINKIEDWGYDKWYPISKEEDESIWNDILETYNFWYTLELLSSTQFQYFIDTIGSSQYITTYFITARSNTKGISSARQSAAWLSRYGFKNPFVIQTEDKVKFIKDLDLKFFIDDAPHNIIDIVDSSVLDYLYVMDAPYNQKIDSRYENKIKRIKSLDEYCNDILDYMNKISFKNSWK